jgi:hypothetical protein
VICRVPRLSRESVPAAKRQHPVDGSSIIRCRWVFDDPLATNLRSGGCGIQDRALCSWNSRSLCAGNESLRDLEQKVILRLVSKASLMLRLHHLAVKADRLIHSDPAPLDLRRSTWSAARLACAAAFCAGELCCIRCAAGSSGSGRRSACTMWDEAAADRSFTDSCDEREAAVVRIPTIPLGVNYGPCERYHSNI